MNKVIAAMHRHDDWASLDSVGVAWVGEASLTRFVNERGEASEHNVIFRKGCLYA